MSQWVKLDTFTMSAQCRFVLQLRKYRCLASIEQIHLDPLHLGGTYEAAI